MMHEEFTVLAKVETTVKYYHESIEPLYTDMNVDKAEFVAWWLKEHKSNIVKSHAFDIDRASRALSLADGNADKLAETLRENKQLQAQAERWETNAKAANSSWQEEKHMAEVWKTECYEAQRQAEQILPLQARINELESEIVRLKVRLFDMIDCA